MSRQAVGLGKRYQHDWLCWQNGQGLVDATVTVRTDPLLPIPSRVAPMNQDTPSAAASSPQTRSPSLPVIAVIFAAYACYLVAGAAKETRYHASYLVSVTSPPTGSPGAVTAEELQSVIAAESPGVKTAETEGSVRYRTEQIDRSAGPLLRVNVSYQGDSQTGIAAASDAADHLADAIRQRIAAKVASVPEPLPPREQLQQIDERLAEMAGNAEQQRLHQGKLLEQRTKLLIAIARESVGEQASETLPQADVRVVRLSQSVRKPLVQRGLVAPAVLALVLVSAVVMLLYVPRKRTFGGAVEATAVLAGPADDVTVQLPPTDLVERQTSEILHRPRRAA